MLVVVDDTVGIVVVLIVTDVVVNVSVVNVCVVDVRVVAVVEVTVRRRWPKVQFCDRSRSKRCAMRERASSSESCGDKLLDELDSFLTKDCGGCRASTKVQGKIPKLMKATKQQAASTLDRLTFRNLQDCRCSHAGEYME
eukprot:TRINITY_DN1324_c0_g3_i1.p2 TRINITY_DN1324_c0_g3~~TRINITY_DN1324_c0_g3_i1.p2  ORF type:complete len:140 (+),score=13.14 TRINITY_DN1324_c0_g3_i1:367-786(+)